MSASTKLAAVSDIKRLAGMFRGILNLADELKEAGTLERDVEEAKGNLEKLRHDAVDMQQNLASELNTMRAAAEQYRIARVTEGDRYLTQAKSDGEKIKTDAESLATSFVAEARKRAGEYQDAVEGAKSQIAELNAQHAALNASHERLQAAHEELTARHSRVLADVAALKSKL